MKNTMQPLKVDVDFKLTPKWIEIWKMSRKTMLEGLGFKVDDIVVHPSDKRGFHAWLHIQNNGGGIPLTPTNRNKLQWLCGDDYGRVLLNQARITRGIDWNRGNKLFSKVLWRREIDERCKKCRKHKMFLALAKDFQEDGQMTIKTKLNNLLMAIQNLEGIEIPYNIIKHNITPLKEWLEREVYTNVGN